MCILAPELDGSRYCYYKMYDIKDIIITSSFSREKTSPSKHVSLVLILVKNMRGSSQKWLWKLPVKLLNNYQRYWLKRLPEKSYKLKELSAKLHMLKLSLIHI